MMWRTQARAFALQMLYQVEVHQDSSSIDFTYFWKQPDINSLDGFYPLSVFRWLLSGNTSQKEKGQEDFNQKVITVQETFENRNKDRHNPNQELVDLFKNLFWNRTENGEDETVEISAHPSEQKQEISLKAFKASDDIIDFANLLVQGTIEHLSTIDQLIDSASEHWTRNRMPLTDLSVLRLATYEILCLVDIPFAVSINEAVELSKIFGTDDSPKFVNGVLDKVKELSSTNHIPLNRLEVSSNQNEEER
ncbi:TPA: transcription antitermination factor NusB [Candidatus Poribacteria bacterium]|nr:transcription antitermination factor NusB [Candidatus Poribacteria bacterium]HIB87834.1 transcription antitermination factor NusB [Candidatus Poribacteria bacterium]HIC00522.1 transcription antitermination factor NusB [Candidatus Poribacteria bacterium]HIC18313.1 transcription antitermination factor NusB [Candidatus Poribacteria bacterium]HIM09972.1 transcription antitermination factor NusB [Candidatus Poribacteria bacterium]